jgi:hypothetical protein
MLFLTWCKADLEFRKGETRQRGNRTLQLKRFMLLRRDKMRLQGVKHMFLKAI